MSKFSRSGTWSAGAPGRTNPPSTIRGKISAPIPILDDDEFPIRSPGTGIATPLGSRNSDGFEKAVRGSALSGRESGLAQVQNAMGTYSEPRRIGTSPQPSGRSSYHTSRRLENANTVRSYSPGPSRSVLSKPQRKKSTLKGVLGKLFGRKKGNASLQTRQSINPGQNEQHHRSDPTALNRTPAGTSSSGSPKRSTSMPINEFNRALRSHSLFHERHEDEANLESNPNRVSTQTQSTTARTRVNTGRLYTPDKAPGYVDWTGLSPRPASSHARGSKSPSVDGAGTIGMAITSGSHPNRRSRSLGQLRDAARAAGGIIRRRSDEIRYWRASYEPGAMSPLSSNKADAEEPLLMIGAESPRPTESDQPQPFNFGQLSGLTGMKITQAADLETRVNQLESRMIEMEKTVYQMHRRLNGDHVTLQDPPKRGSRRDWSRPTTDNSELTLPPLPRSRDWQNEFSTQHQTNSYGPKRPSSSAHNSYHPDFDDTVTPMDDRPHLGTIQHNVRPLSTSTTVRGVPSSSSPTMPKDTMLNSEHYNNLTNMILVEQQARQHLENVVLSLQQQLTSVQPKRTSTSYPTPDSATAGPDRQMRGTSLNKSAFSGFGQNDSDDENENAYGTITPEVFQTPMEELGGPHFGDEVFGNASGRQSAMDAAEMKGDSRTLSLSQITMGRGLQPSVNF